jgi:hypothetical protein
MSMKTFQKLSKTGKPMINKHDSLPIYVKSINARLNLIKTELGITETKKPQLTFKHEENSDWLDNYRNNLTV